MLFVRSTLFNISFYVNVIVFMIACSVVFFLPARPAFIVVKTWCRSNLWLLKVIAGIDVDVRGQENLPDGGYLVASKHQSVWETFAIIPLFDYPTYIAKRELTWIPLFGWYLLKFGMIPVDRGKGSKALKAMIGHARNALENRRQIMIFPEGTRTAPGTPPRYKIGVARLYAECNVPCVPVALNSGLYWPRRQWLRYPGTVRVRILPPIEPGLSVDDCLETLQSRLEPAANALIEEAARDPNPPPLATRIATLQPV